MEITMIFETPDGERTIYAAGNKITEKMALDMAINYMERTYKNDWRFIRYECKNLQN